MASFSLPAPLRMLSLALAANTLFGLAAPLPLPQGTTPAVDPAWGFSDATVSATMKAIALNGISVEMPPDNDPATQAIDPTFAAALAEYAQYEAEGISPDSTVTTDDAKAITAQDPKALAYQQGKADLEQQVRAALPFEEAGSNLDAVKTGKPVVVLLDPLSTTSRSPASAELVQDPDYQAVDRFSMLEPGIQDVVNKLLKATAEIKQANPSATEEQMTQGFQAMIENVAMGVDNTLAGKAVDVALVNTQDPVGGKSATLARWLGILKTRLQQAGVKLTVRVLEKGATKIDNAIGTLDKLGKIIKTVQSKVSPSTTTTTDPGTTTEQPADQPDAPDSNPDDPSTTTTDDPNDPKNPKNPKTNPVKAPPST